MNTTPTTAHDVTDAPIRVVLVGNERVTRAGLRMLLDGRSGIRVIGEFECAADLHAVWSASPPQIAVVDLDGHGNVEFIPDARESANRQTRTIVLTGTPESAVCSSAIQRGVLGVVSKQEPPEILVKAIERVHAGEVWLNRAAIAGVVGEMRAVAAQEVERQAVRPSNLPARERHIITLVGRGLRNNEIAAAIFVSEATVRNCLASIFRKLGISNRVHLMIYSIQEGFTNLPVSNRPSTTSAGDSLRLATSAGRTFEDTE
jgi:DNA-binding NarL/FixJ family response regulator